MDGTSTQSAPAERIETWRKIGNFLGKDQRTAKRWEAERGMPVHRLPGGGNAAVYAYTAELSRWLAATARAPEFLQPPVQASNEPPTPQQARSRAKVWALLGAITASVVAAALILALGPTLTRSLVSKREAARHVPDVQVLELFRQGRYEWNRRTPDGLKAALSDFSNAIVRDPAYADAYVGLADTYNLSREFGAISSEEAYPKAEWAARRAVELDEQSAAAHASLGFVRFHWDWDTAGARREFERAIQLDPRNSMAHHWYATALLELGLYKTALEQIDQAETLSPESAAIRADKAFILDEMGQAAAGERVLKELESADPGFLSPHTYLAQLYFEQSRFPDYVRELEVAARLQDSEESRRFARASEQGLNLAGAQGMLQGALDAERSLYEEGRANAHQLARVYAQAGDADQALHYAAVAVARHDPDAIAIVADPAFRSLHRPAQIRALFRNVALPVYPQQR